MEMEAVEQATVGDLEGDLGQVRILVLLWGRWRAWASEVLETEEEAISSMLNHKPDQLT